MFGFLENLIARIWNTIASRRGRRPADRNDSKLDFGAVIKDGLLTKHRFGLSQTHRAEHIAILGKTGSGKSYLLRHLASQDVERDHGFVYFDLHGDTTPFLLSRIAEREPRERIDLSDRTVVIQPADPLC